MPQREEGQSRSCKLHSFPVYKLPKKQKEFTDKKALRTVYTLTKILRYTCVRTYFCCFCSWAIMSNKVGTTIFVWPVSCDHCNLYIAMNMDYIEYHRVMNLNYISMSKKNFGWDWSESVKWKIHLIKAKHKLWLISMWMSYLFLQVVLFSRYSCALWKALPCYYVPLITRLKLDI